MSGQVKKEIQQNKPMSQALEAMLNVQRTATVLRAAVERVTGLKHVEYNVLRILRGAGSDGLSVEDIRSRLLADDPMLLGYIGGMVGRGLIGPEVKRRIISAEGLRVLADLDTRVERMVEESIGRLTSAETRTLIDLLEKLRG
ncbi:MAG TPA: hypothetical protein VE913_07680 [Longimicrobium sp.]|nr:hypothetical protein [Longimicrobium sp.]